jgi:hydroxymethylpyrimidine kinase/phosphomethylpyrimidine kinase
MGKVIPRALTIAGSDSGGGAGIQADLKTFEALGVHGMSAITALTSQNTKEVTEIFNVPKETVVCQIEAIRSDIGFDAAKTGMLENEEIITAISDYFEEHREFKNLVVDPVMVSKSGATLLQRSALNALIDKLLPLSYIVTPNAEEARVLIGSSHRSEISSIEQAADAARKISEYGPRIVIVKGGHLQRSKRGAVDVVYQRARNKVWYLESGWYDTKNTHGTGCVFSAAIAAELAKGTDIEKALTTAKEFVTNAIRFGLNIGHGNGPVNPVGTLLRRADKIGVVQELSRAVEALTNAAGFENLIPESRTNFVACGTYSETIDDVAAIPGRITTVFGKPVAVGGIAFGGSDHMARFLLSAKRIDGTIRSAINLRYSKELLSVLKSVGLSFAAFDRDEEPSRTRSKEGHTMDWAVAHVARRMKDGKLPVAIIDLGGIGKEQMIMLLGKSPQELAVRVTRIAARAQKGV